jgi:hypothetical protein
VPWSGAGRDGGLAHSLQPAVGEAKGLHLVDAEIGRSNEPAVWVEDNTVGMRGLLAVLVWAGAGVLQHAAHGAEPSIGLNGQYDQIATDVVGDNQVVSRRIHSQMRLKERLRRTGVKHRVIDRVAQQIV